MPKYQIEREGQTFSILFFSVKFLQLQQKIEPYLDAKKGRVVCKKESKDFFSSIKKRKTREVLSKQKNNNFSFDFDFFVF